MDWPVIFFCCFALLALAGLLDGLYRLYLSWRSLSWSLCQGVVIKNRIQRYISPSEGLPWSHEFQIDYHYGQKKFHLYKPCPSWQAINLLGSYGLKLTRNVVYKFPVDSQVSLWVDPAQPARAVLLPGLNRLCWIHLICMPTLFASLAGFCYLRYLSN